MNRTFIIISLISNICLAEPELPVIGFNLPLPSIESKKAPIVLDCGVTIEYNLGARGPLPLKDYGLLNKLCSDVVSYYKNKFPEFTLPAKINVPVSFMTRNTLVSNFGHRVSGTNETVYLDGFTDINSFGKPEHFYVLSDRKNLKYFKTVFAHELFHVLNALSSHDDSEEGAAEFTSGMGLGI